MRSRALAVLSWCAALIVLARLYNLPALLGGLFA